MGNNGTLVVDAKDDGIRCHSVVRNDHLNRGAAARSNDETLVMRVE
jgi:hypothetical protein